MTEKRVCVFPHSDDEFETEYDLRRFLRDELGQRGGWYLLRKIGWKDKDFKARVIPGSLVLFRKKGFIVGQAISKTMIKELEPPEEVETETGEKTIYYHEIFFVPESIEVYLGALLVEELESWSGRRLYPRTYAILGTIRDFEKAFPDR